MRGTGKVLSFAAVIMLALLLSGCSGGDSGGGSGGGTGVTGGGGGGGGTLANYAPVVSGIQDQTIPSGGNFNTIDLNAMVTDLNTPDGDIRWTFSQGALTVNIAANNLATITYPAGWTGSEQVCFTATDPEGGSSTVCVTFTVNSVINREDVTFLIKSFYINPGTGTNDPLPNIKITLTDRTTTGVSYSCITDSTGSCTIQGVPDGNYDTTIEDLSGTNANSIYNAGITRVDANKAAQGKLDLEVRLFLPADLASLNCVSKEDDEGGAEHGGALPPVWDIYTTEIRSGARVHQALIDGVVSALKGEISQLYGLPITDADINIIDAMPPLPAPGTEGRVTVYWDNNFARGGHYGRPGTYRGLSGIALSDISAGYSAVMGKICEVLEDRGERDDHGSAHSESSEDDDDSDDDGHSDRDHEKGDHHDDDDHHILNR